MPPPPAEWGRRRDCVSLLMVSLPRIEFLQVQTDDLNIHPANCDYLHAVLRFLCVRNTVGSAAKSLTVAPYHQLTPYQPRNPRPHHAFQQPHRFQHQRVQGRRFASVGLR